MDMTSPNFKTALFFDTDFTAEKWNDLFIQLNHLFNNKKLQTKSEVSELNKKINLIIEAEDLPHEVKFYLSILLVHDVYKKSLSTFKKIIPFFPIHTLLSQTKKILENILLNHVKLNEEVNRQIELISQHVILSAGFSNFDLLAQEQFTLSQMIEDSLKRAIKDINSKLSFNYQNKYYLKLLELESPVE